MMPVSDNMNTDFNVEDDIPEEETGAEIHTFQPSNTPEQCPSRREFLRDKRIMLQEFRVQALQGEIHERYAPLRSSPLRNEIDPADLPDPEISEDAETIDDRGSGSALRNDGSDSDTDGVEESSRAGSSSDSSFSSSSSSDEWYESDGRALQCHLRVGDGAEEDTRAVGRRSAPFAPLDSELVFGLRLMMETMVVAGPRRCAELKCGLGS